MNIPNSNGEVKKILNTSDVLVVAFGAMIGWGWVVSSGAWIQRAGALGTAIAFLIGGVMIYFVGQAYAELTTAIPVSGGAQVFSNRAFGPIGSFICTWSVILSYIGVVCFEACSLPTIIQYIFPGFLQGYLYTVAGFDVYLSWLICALFFTGIITYINIIGIKAAAILQKVLTIIIAVVGIILMLMSTLKGDAVNLKGQLFVGDTIENTFMNVLSIATVAPFFLFGFDVIPQAAEEINVPLKKMGRLLILSIALAVGFYGLVVLAVGYSMNAEEITVSMQGSGLVTADAMAKLFQSETMAKLLILGGLCGVVTSWNSFLIGGSRAMMAMADAYMIPHIFSRTHPKYKTPYIALLLVALLSVVSLFFGRAMLVWIADSASFACCLTYCIVSMSFVKLRKKEPNLPRPYSVKYHKWVGFLAVFLSGIMCVLYLLPETGCTLTTQEQVICCSWVILGGVFAVACKIKYKEKFGK